MTEFTIFLGLLGIYIAYQQWLTGDLAVKEKLFDRRLAIYDATMEFVTQLGSISEDQLIAEASRMRKRTRDAFFIFDKKIDDYLTILYRRAIDLSTDRTVAEMASTTAGERTRLINRAGETVKWFLVESDNMRALFAPYLSLRRTHLLGFLFR